MVSILYRDSLFCFFNMLCLKNWCSHVFPIDGINILRFFLRELMIFLNNMLNSSFWVESHKYLCIERLSLIYFSSLPLDYIHRVPSLENTRTVHLGPQHAFALDRAPLCTASIEYHAHHPNQYLAKPIKPTVPIRACGSDGSDLGIGIRRSVSAVSSPSPSSTHPSIRLSNGVQNLLLRSNTPLVSCHHLLTFAH
jgi:hypothetical protein